MDLNLVADALPLITAIASPALAAAALVWRKINRMSRTIAALGRAVEHGDAHNRGVVLILTYPGAKKSSRALLELNEWKICEYEVQPEEGILPSGAQVMEDLKIADAVVLQGISESQNTELALFRPFRDNLRSGAGVVMYTAGHNMRYDLSKWGDGDQGVTVPATVEAAVRATIARREAIAKRQGIRPGSLGAARDALKS